MRQEPQESPFRNPNTAPPFTKPPNRIEIPENSGLRVLSEIISQRSHPREVDGTPLYGFRIRKDTGGDPLLDWTDEASARNDPCVVYRIYAAENEKPNERADFRLIGVTPLDYFLHRGATGSGIDYIGKFPLPLAQQGFPLSERVSTSFHLSGT